MEGKGSDESDAYATFNPHMSIAALTTIEKMMLVRALPLFHVLAPDDLEEITAIAAEKTFQPGDYLCRTGEAGNSVYVIIRGTVRVFTGATQEEGILSQLGAGSYLGEMAVLDSSPRSASAVAMEKTRVLELPGEEFKDLMYARPAISASVITNLVGRLRTLIQKAHAPK